MTKMTVHHKSVLRKVFESEEIKTINTKQQRVTKKYLDIQRGVTRKILSQTRDQDC